MPHDQVGPFDTALPARRSAGMICSWTRRSSGCPSGVGKQPDMIDDGLAAAAVRAGVAGAAQT